MYLQPVHSSGTSLYPNRGEGSPLPASFYSGRTCTKEQEHLQVPKRGDGSRLSAGFCVLRWWAAPTWPLYCVPLPGGTLAPVQATYANSASTRERSRLGKFGLEGNSELRWTPPVRGRVLPRGRGGSYGSRSVQRSLVGFARLVHGVLAISRLLQFWAVPSHGNQSKRLEALDRRPTAAPPLRAASTYGSSRLWGSLST